MKLVNTTDYPDFFVRRMHAWCCRELSKLIGRPYRVKDLRKFVLRNRSDGCTSGRSWSGSRRICVSLGQINLLEAPPGMASRFDADAHCYRVSYPDSLRWGSRTRSLVRVTAHELFHQIADLMGINTRGYGRGQGSSEHQTEWHEAKVLAVFEADQERLIAEWSKPPARTAAAAERKPSSRRDRNARRAATSLAAWERRLKMARTKVAKYRRAVRRYERDGVLQAATSGK